MGSDAQITAEGIQKALEPYVRSREEVSHIRRVLSLHLLSTCENGPQPRALALSDADCNITSTAGVRGLQRDYLKALHANIKARRDQDAIREAGEESKTITTRKPNDADRLEEYVTFIKLKKKKERLQTVEKYLKLLGQKPAASPEFLRPDEIFKDAGRLPLVPEAVVNGFAVNKDSASTDLKGRVDSLEKAVLRSKLLLKKEEQLLEEVKSRFTAKRTIVSNGAKLAALSTTRNKLIGWMETELGKASLSDELQHEEGDDKLEAAVYKERMHEKLAKIKHKYANYVAARKALLQLVAEHPQPTVQPTLESKTQTRPETVSIAPSTHLITPYIEGLIRVGQEQRASIAHKSHISALLAKQTEATVQAIDRLTRESQLIPDHPMPDTARRKQGLPADPRIKDSAQLTNCVQPWVFAADAAKLATLETVAEKIEEGQLALEGSTSSLAEIDKLLGRNTGQEGDSAVEEDTIVDDIWLAESASPRNRPIPKERARNKSIPVKEKRDIWSTLDGSVGLINADDSPRKHS